MFTHLFMQNKNLKQIFLWPIVFGILSAVALVMALMEDGTVEQVSLLGLFIPIIVIVYFYWIKKT